jgi:hypothetical protein
VDMLISCRSLLGLCAAPSADSAELLAPQSEPGLVLLLVVPPRLPHPGDAACLAPAEVPPT